MKISEYLLSFVGRPYIWGGDGSGECDGGFDCSGLVLEGLWAFGLYGGSDTTAQGLYKSLRAEGWIPVPRFLENDGDVLFFGKDTAHITHTAMALGDGLMVEAGGGGSKCKSAATSSGMVRVRPIREDVVAAFRKP